MVNHKNFIALVFFLMLGHLSYGQLISLPRPPKVIFSVGPTFKLKLGEVKGSRWACGFEVAFWDLTEREGKAIDDWRRPNFDFGFEVDGHDTYIYTEFQVLAPGNPTLGGGIGLFLKQHKNKFSGGLQTTAWGGYFGLAYLRGRFTLEAPEVSSGIMLKLPVGIGKR